MLFRRPGWGGWHRSPFMSVRRARAASYSNGDVFVVAGGTSNGGAITDTVEKFDGTAWTSAQSLPAATKG